MLMGQMLPMIEVAENEHVLSLTLLHYKRRMAIASSLIALSHALNAQLQRRNECRSTHVKSPTNVPDVVYYCGRGRGTAAYIVHTVLFRARRFRPQDFDKAEQLLANRLVKAPLTLPGPRMSI